MRMDLMRGIISLLQQFSYQKLDKFENSVDSSPSSISIGLTLPHCLQLHKNCLHSNITACLTCFERVADALGLGCLDVTLEQSMVLHDVSRRKPGQDYVEYEDVGYHNGHMG